MCRSNLCLSLVIAAFGWTGLAFSQAEERAVLGIGLFSARHGSGGSVIQGGYYFSLEAGQIYEMGGDLQYRELRTSVFGVDDVRVTSWSVPAIVALKLVQTPPFVPYIGAGLILGLATFDKHFIETRQPALSIQNSSVYSFGGLLVGGARVELESGIVFFAEYRYGWDSFTTDLNGTRNAVDMGGAWILGGAGIRF